MSLERIETKIDRLDDKVDLFMKQQASNTEAIAWLKGHAKIITTLGVTILGGLVLYFIQGS